jgi:hypothetical protein
MTHQLPRLKEDIKLYSNHNRVGNIGTCYKRRITVEERFRQNIMFNQKWFRIGTLEPTDITSTTYDKYVYILLEILLFELRSLNSICFTLLRIL